MWKRLKRRILRSKTGGGGVYNPSSHGDEFTDSRDTYRDFREELYDESRGTGSWKDGGVRKSGRRTSAAKTPFPNLDRCSCGTPGGRDLQENVAKSETLRRKNDFILGTDGKAGKGGVGAEKTNNEYTSTSTGPGTRSRRGQQDGQEQRLRASTSTGQIPCSGERSEEQTRSEWNNRRRNGRSPGAPARRLAYSDDDDEDSEDTEEESEYSEEVSEDGEEEEEEPPPRVPSTSQPFRNSSQSDATKSSSNSSDYTSLAFDTNYVKVSPPKPRRRGRQKSAPSVAADKNSAPLMVRRERRRFPETSSTLSERLPPRAVDSKRPTVVESGKQNGATTSSILRLDGASEPRISKDGDIHSRPCVQLQNDVNRRQPAAVLASCAASRQQESSGYVAWADIHNPSAGMSSNDDSKSVCTVVSGSERVGAVEARAPEGRGCELSSSGSVLQFTFTVRLDNDVIRGTRREVDRSNGVAAAEAAASGSSLVSGRVDILNQDQPGGTSVSALNQRQQVTCVPGSESVSLLQRSFKVQLQDQGPLLDTTRNLSTQKSGKIVSVAASSNTDLDKDTAPIASHERQIVVGSGSGDRCPPTTRRTAFGVSGRQRTIEDELASDSPDSRMTTVAIVHKSGSDHGEDPKVATLGRTELGPTDGRDNNFRETDDHPVPKDEGKSESRLAFNDVDCCRCCAANSSRSVHQCQTSPPKEASDSVEAGAEDGSELTHMNWDEVMKEAQSLGIPLSRPLPHQQQQQQQQEGGCDRTRRQSTSPDQQVSHRSSSSPPSKLGSTAFQDVYWVCRSCTEAMQNQQPSSAAAVRKTLSKTTSSPFKEKFKLQSIFYGSSGGGGGGGGRGGGGKKQAREEKSTRKGQALSSSPLGRKGQSPGAKYTTMPTSNTTTATTKDVVLWGGQNCSCASSRRLQTTNRQRSLSPVSSTRVVQSSPKTAGLWGRGGDRRGQRVSHLCSPPLLRCRFSSTGRALQGSSPSILKSANLSTEILTSSSSPVRRRANDNDRDFLKSLAQLMGCNWYWGTLSFEAAEAELKDRPDGAFLVRDSSDDRYILSVSFRSQRSTHHVRIERHNGMFSFSAEHGLHESADIVDFIENAMEWSQSGQCLYYLRPRQVNTAPVPVQLIYPVSRFAH